MTATGESPPILVKNWIGGLDTIPFHLSKNTLAEGIRNINSPHHLTATPPRRAANPD